MKKLILLALAASLAACGQMGGPVEAVCHPAVDCITDAGWCFSCNAGYVCGDGSKDEVSCIKKDVFNGGPWNVTVAGCPQAAALSYSGAQYAQCYNNRRAALKSGCTIVSDNCHGE